MANRTHVPKFGSWDTNDPLPYTTVFDHARASKVGKFINPNDPAENPELAAAIALSEGSNKGGDHLPAPARFSNANDREDGLTPMARARHDRRMSRQESDGRHQTEVSARHRESAAWKSFSESRMQGDNPPRNGGRGNPVGGISRATSAGPPPPPRQEQVEREGGSMHLSERMNGEGANHNPNWSPVQSYQGRQGKAGGVSPTWEPQKWTTSGDEGSVFAPGTPGRSRPRTGNSRAEEPLVEKAGALPKFGAWDAKDPASGDGFTVIFNNARNEKKTGGSVRIPPLQPDSPARNEEDLYKPPNIGAQKHQVQKKFFCCFQPTDVQL